MWVPGDLLLRYVPDYTEEVDEIKGDSQTTATFGNTDLLDVPAQPDASKAQRLPHAKLPPDTPFGSLQAAKSINKGDGADSRNSALHSDESSDAECEFKSCGMFSRKSPGRPREVLNRKTVKRRQRNDSDREGII